jgi:hypothetical protein
MAVRQVTQAAVITAVTEALPARRRRAPNLRWQNMRGRGR